jgi:hypothetical protein
MEKETPPDTATPFPQFYDDAVEFLRAVTLGMGIEGQSASSLDRPLDFCDFFVDLLQKPFLKLIHHHAGQPTSATKI